MGDVIDMPYSLEYQNNCLYFWTYEAANKALKEVVGDGLCVFHAVISCRGEIVYEIIPLIVDGEVVES